MNELVREAGWITTDASEAKRRRVERLPASGSFRRDVSLLATALFVFEAGALAIGAPMVFMTGVLLLFLVVGGPLVMLSRLDSLQEVDRENALSEFDGGPGTLVSLIVRQGDAPTGADIGMLWFEDGRLYFSRRRTSFGLVPGQARSLSPIRDAVKNVRNPVELVLRHDTVAGAMALSFAPILPPYESAFVHTAALRTDIAEWLGAWADGSGQFPPADLGPGAISEKSLLARAISATLIPALLVGLFFHFVFPLLASTAFCLSLSLAAATIPAANLRWRALRDRRRLRR